MARKENVVKMKTLMNKFFAYINNSKNKPDMISSMVEFKNTDGSETETHYKWWGDDRYEPI
jgi:hypothetical protein